MRDFVYQNATKILFGDGQIRHIRDLVPLSSRTLIVAGQGSIRANGVHKQVLDALNNHRVFEFWGIQPNPDVAQINEAFEVAKRENIDYILAVGGGSVVDAAKFLAGLLRTDGNSLEILLRGGRFTDAVPLGVIVTAPGTGSESNTTGAISHRESKKKIVFSSENCRPQFAILDPATTFTLPIQQLANGIVDAYVHVIEQYLTYPSGGFVSDRLAESLLLTFIECGSLAISEPENYVARANLMWAANLALNGLVGLGVPQDWSTHHIGHEITALYGIEHARTLAALLPAVLSNRRKQKREKLLQYGLRIFNIQSGTEDERLENAINRTRVFFESLGLATRLSAYELSIESIPPIISNLKASRRIRLGERLDITLDNVFEILQSAL
jgi:NADP-dependent alcohol dehydrogenase